MQDPLFYQLFDTETSTYTYLLADAELNEAILIDPVLEHVERDLKLISELGLVLRYVLDTHIHADHITGAGEIRKRTGATTVVGAGAKVNCADKLLEEGDEIRFGKHALTAIETPGHTDSCMSYLIGDRVFTGDALLARGTGRTDFQQGSSTKLYDSITRKLFRLPDETLVFPAHDYKGVSHTTIGEEKTHNPRIAGKTEAQFAQIMGALNLAQPKKLAESVPANLACGKVAGKSAP